MVKNILVKLANDEVGFIVSAELVLVATISVLAMVVGLSEVAHNINNELEDIGSAFGNMTQTYQVYGTSGHKGSTEGSSFYDVGDYCDNYCDIVSTTPTGEQ
ncbi:MAG: branched-chain amino acid aminotransferase [Planctomycetaceae bacterium]|nr:branched-chain amino acid aminotransferase [Planctomycetaceae bacterium]